MASRDSRTEAMYLHVPRGPGGMARDVCPMRLCAEGCFFPEFSCCIGIAFLTSREGSTLWDTPKVLVTLQAKLQSVPFFPNVNFAS